ncbi:MAG: biotin transport system substrate-specific component [Gaiellales bacterium]|nr:biotin transport system substrate-specific component [Gaiellales bacterium]
MQHGTLAASRDNILANVGLIAGAATLTAACAQVSFGTPVPTTLQTLAVFATATVLGARRAVAAQLLYLTVGAVGAPVFADGKGGADILTTANPLHTSGGYLWGFLLAAAVVGYASDRFGTSYWVTLPAMLLGSVALYVPGLVWLHQALPTPWTGSGGTTFNYGFWPFALGDLAKILAAAAIADPRAPWGKLVDRIRI